jgi:hypothetical protein
MKVFDLARSHCKFNYAILGCVLLANHMYYDWSFSCAAASLSSFCALLAVVIPGHSSIAWCALLCLSSLSIVC